MDNLIEELSVLTTIPEDALNRLRNKAMWCIVDSFVEDKLIDKNESKVDIGIGTLVINDEEDCIYYKFIPNETLEQAIIQASIKKRSPLENNLEKGLASKIINTYKDIL